MKIIETNEFVYVRHWFKWYWLNVNRLTPVISEKLENEELEEDK